MNIKLYYDLWQLECCGDSFKIGDKISWHVVKANGNGSTIGIDDLDYYYEEHGNEKDTLFLLEGTIDKISIHYIKYKLVENENHNMYVPIEGSSEFIKSSNSDIKEVNRNNHTADGYLIELKDVIIRKVNNK